MGSENFSENITWTKKLEEYFSTTGERAHCLSWAHKRAEELYSKRRTYIDLPVIVLSSVTGFCSVGASTMFAGQEQLSGIILGVVSLFVAILNTTGTYFGWAKRSEAHKISSVHYAKLYRFMKIEMALPRDERMLPHDLLKYCKENYERLAEISPLIPPEIISDFRSRFRKQKNISFPEEMNGLDPIEVFDPKSEEQDGSASIVLPSYDSNSSGLGESTPAPSMTSSVYDAKSSEPTEKPKLLSARPVKKQQQSVQAQAQGQAQSQGQQSQAKSRLPLKLATTSSSSNPLTLDLRQKLSSLQNFSTDLARSKSDASSGAPDLKGLLTPFMNTLAHQPAAQQAASKLFAKLPPALQTLVPDHIGPISFAQAPSAAATESLPPTPSVVEQTPTESVMQPHPQEMQHLQQQEEGETMANAGEFQDQKQE
jgi:hypothetical protein